MPEAVCITRCFDSKLCRRYWPGDKDNIDKDNPISTHFEFAEESEPKKPGKKSSERSE